MKKFRHSRLIVPMNDSAKAFASGALCGIWMTLATSEVQTVSKRALNFVSASRIRNSGVIPYSAHHIKVFRACWVTHSESGA